jgi:hypothetical protein
MMLDPAVHATTGPDIVRERGLGGDKHRREIEQWVAPSTSDRPLA